MRVRILVSAAVLLGCLICSGSLPATQPTFSPEETPSLAQTPRSVEERLDAIERQLHLILRHLGFSVSRPWEPVPGERTADPAMSGGRISQIENESGRTQKRIDEIERQLNNIKAQPRPIVSGNGKLILQNLSGLSHYVSINGTRHLVSPGRTEIWVPRAIVEVYLPNHEFPKLWGMSNWKWTGQHHEMSINIRGN